MATGSSVLRSQTVPIFLKAYAAAGGDEAALSARFGLPRESVTKREVDASLDTIEAIANAAAEQAGDPNLGFHLALCLPPGAYGLLEYIGRSAATLRQAGERFVRYSALLNELTSFDFTLRGDVAVLRQRIDGYPPCVGRHPGEMFVTLIVRFLYEATDFDWLPSAIAFAHPAPADPSELAGYFRAPVSWGTGENRIALPLALLDRAVVTSDAMLFKLLDEQAEKVLTTRARHDAGDFLMKTRAEMRVALEHGQPELAAVARALKMSARTLQRRLEGEGTNFQELVDSVRHELARIYIADPKYALGEVAYLLGFSEISAFTRAFKRWTGMTPTAWRAGSKDLA
jgi:AraC-like DNA-binding protein